MTSWFLSVRIPCGNEQKLSLGNSIFWKTLENVVSEVVETRRTVTWRLLDALKNVGWKILTYYEKFSEKLVCHPIYFCVLYKKFFERKLSEGLQVGVWKIFWDNLQWKSRYMTHFDSSFLDFPGKLVFQWIKGTLIIYSTNKRSIFPILHINRPILGVL